jgi:hypothetical protein
MLGLLELLLRALPAPWPELRQLDHLRDFYRLDPDGRLRTNPGWRGAVTVEGRTTAIELDDLGLREPSPKGREPGARRVLVLGDSFVLGLGVLGGEAIPAQLEAALRALGHPTAVGNAGMYGTSLREWGYTLARLRPEFAPDVVVAVLYLGNDFQDALSPPLSVLDGYVLPAPFAHAARSSWRWQLGLQCRTWFYVERLLNRIAPIVVPQPPQLLPEGVSPAEGIFFDQDPRFDPETPFLGAVEQLFAGHFEALRRAAGDLPVLVVLLPAHEVALRPWPAAVAAALPGLPVERFRRGEGARRLTRLATAHGFAVQDLDLEFAAAPDPARWFLPTDWHLSPAGCAQVALWIAGDVAALLPP